MPDVVSRRTSRAPSRRLVMVWMAVCLGLGGCASFEKKFVRKPKQAVKPTPVVRFKAYLPSKSLEEMYRQRFTQWDFWCGELLGGFGVSRKKIQHASTETLGQLGELQRFLPAEDAQRLQRIISRHRVLDRRIQSGDLSETDEQVFKRHFEDHQRFVRRHCNPKRVHDRLQTPEQDVAPVMEPPPGGSAGETVAPAAAASP